MLVRNSIKAEERRQCALLGRGLGHSSGQPDKGHVSAGRGGWAQTPEETAFQAEGMEMHRVRQECAGIFGARYPPPPANRA